jgi:hypothetical protein
MKLEDMNAEQLAEYYEKLEKKNYMAYQESGDPKYDRAYYRYSQIASAFRAKVRDEGEHEIDLKKRMTNKDAVIGRLIPGKMYTTAEVEKLLNEAVWW